MINEDYVTKILDDSNFPYRYREGPASKLIDNPMLVQLMEEPKPETMYLQLKCPTMDHFFSLRKQTMCFLRYLILDGRLNQEVRGMHLSFWDILPRIDYRRPHYERDFEDICCNGDRELIVISDLIEIEDSDLPVCQRFLTKLLDANKTVVFWGKRDIRVNSPFASLTDKIKFFQVS